MRLSGAFRQVPREVRRPDAEGSKASRTSSTSRREEGAPAIAGNAEGIPRPVFARVRLHTSMLCFWGLSSTQAGADSTQIHTNRPNPSGIRPSLDELGRPQVASRPQCAPNSTPTRPEEEKATRTRELPNMCSPHALKKGPPKCPNAPPTRLQLAPRSTPTLLLMAAPGEMRDVAEMLR